MSFDKWEIVNVDGFDGEWRLVAWLYPYYPNPENKLAYVKSFPEYTHWSVVPEKRLRKLES